MTEQPWLMIDSYSAIRINMYKGKYAIQKARRTEKDNYIEWTNPLRYDSEAGESRPATKNDGSPLLIPLQIPLGGNAQAAADMLKALYFQLVGKKIDGQEGEEPPLPEGMPDDMGGDVPF